MQCSLCGSETILYSEAHNRKYYKCPQCKGILLDSIYFLSTEAEKERYRLHENDVHDLGYQKFVSPIVNAINEKYKSNHKGLDFGSGKDSVIAYQLQKKGYNISTYDPFFDPDNNALQTKYDYIACCEVIEHFNNPTKEFKLLHSLLHKGGILFCKTNLHDESINFDSWWYKNDATHVFFYSYDTLHWVQQKFKFKTIEVANDLIIFTK
ncbi:class I SAM-dependent methyltransferase [Aquimarina sp. 2304DJ70-9]|uniref:class I SAM-dependent methyltransferase n=1 Tax=Aquimarina penaris TaxID=3231044 RepID=UPI0034623A87